MRQKLLTIIFSVMISWPYLAIAASDSMTYTYDAQGRLKTVTYQNGTVITYSYDIEGNRTSVVIACGVSGC